MNASASITRLPSARPFDNEVARKAAVCAKVLAEARRLTDQWNFGPPLSDLVARACELLDDIDEVLIALDPVRDVESFATAAALHRDLEHIQTAASASSRRHDQTPDAPLR